MIDFFTSLHPNATSKKIIFLDNLRFYSLIRFIVRQSANLIMPLYYRLSNLFRQYELEKGKNNESELIVSLTTFPARIDKVWLVIESILRQTVKPDKIILWLSEDQFNSLKDIPERLLKMRERGLEIGLCEGDIRSHKKYFYTVKHYPEATFVTVDDDLMYPSYMLETLLGYHKKYPNTVCFNRGYEGLTDGRKIMPYKSWVKLAGETPPSSNIFPTTGGGTLYPPNVLPEEVLNKEIFMKYCKYADDIWLFCMVLLNEKKFVKTNMNILLIPILGKSTFELSSINVHDNKNDEQLMAVRDYFLNQKGINIFNIMINDKMDDK